MFDRIQGVCCNGSLIHSSPHLLSRQHRKFSCFWHWRTWLLPGFTRKIKDTLVFPHPYKVLFCSWMCWEENESMAREETLTIHISVLYAEPGWSSHSLSEEKPTCSHVISKTFGILLGKWGHCPSSCLGLCALQKKWRLCRKIQRGGTSRLILYSKSARGLERSSSLGCPQPGGSVRC